MTDWQLYEEAAEAYERLGSFRKAADELGVHHSTIIKRVRAFHAGEQPQGSAVTERKSVDVKADGDTRIVTGKGFRSVEDLLEAAGISESDGWVVVKHMLNSWEALAKDNQIVQLYQVKAWLERAPSFFVKPVKCNPLPRQKSAANTELKCTLVIPDSQHGFIRHEDGTLEPMHDRRAVDIAIQMARMLSGQIDEIVLMGDMLDLGPFSRWSSEPGIRFVTQPALVEVHWMIAQLRLAAPHARIVYLEGNHELRIEKQLKEFAAGELLNIRPADTLEAPPVLSIRSLLALDALDCEYVQPYGAPHWWRGVRFQHGHLARPRGKTAAAYLSNATSSTVWGHTHRLELAMRTLDTPKGISQMTAMSPGCLCRTDGAVPHSGGSSPLDWQQGLGVIWSNNRDDNRFELIQIIDGRAVYQGRELVGDDRVEELRRSTGYPF